MVTVFRYNERALVLLTGNGYDGDVLVTWGPEHSEDEGREGDVVAWRMAAGHVEIVVERTVDADVEVSQKCDSRSQ